MESDQRRLGQIARKYMSHRRSILQADNYLFVLIIKALLRITFPVAVALSFIYGAEKTIGAWWQSYITVTMMSFIIAAIEILQNLLLFDVASNSLSVAQLGIALMAFAFGAAYLCAPTLTVLCVGGSEAAAQLPQQITTSFMTVGAMTWGILKSRSVTSGQFFKETYLKQKKEYPDDTLNNRP